MSYRFDYLTYCYPLSLLVRRLKALPDEFDAMVVTAVLVEHYDAAHQAIAVPLPFKALVEIPELHRCCIEEELDGEAQGRFAGLTQSTQRQMRAFRVLTYRTACGVQAELRMELSEPPSWESHMLRPLFDGALEAFNAFYACLMLRDPLKHLSVEHLQERLGLDAKAYAAAIRQFDEDPQAFEALGDYARKLLARRESALCLA